MPFAKKKTAKKQSVVQQAMTGAPRLVGGHQMATANSAVASALGRAVRSYNKAHKRSRLWLASEEGLLGKPAGWLSTGDFLLDCYLGGGVPLGKVIQIWGRPGTGKTSLAMSIAREVQLAGGLAVPLDAEMSWEEERIALFGLDPARLSPAKAPTLEDGFDVIEDATLSYREQPALKDVPIIFIWDTIRKSRTRAQLKQKGSNDRYSAGIAERPGIIANGLQRIEEALMSHKIGLVIVNQASSKMGGRVQGGLQASGGFGFQHTLAYSVRLDESYPKGPLFVKGTDTQVGMTVTARLDKRSKLSGRRPYDPTANFTLRWETGLERYLSAVQWLAECGEQKKIVKVKGVYQFNFNGRLLKANPLDVSALVHETTGLAKFVRVLTRKHFLRPAPQLQLEASA